MNKKVLILKRGGNNKMNKKYKPLNLSKLDGKKSTVVSSERALEDISPLNWSKSVSSGKKKVLLKIGN